MSIIFNRTALIELNKWNKSSNRKPLIIRGARQVGKTFLINEFAKNFKNYIRLNLEKQEDISYFSSEENIKTIVDSIFLSNNISYTEIQNTLLFIDEIQESPYAIWSLRYFYEEYPELKVIAAGYWSLL